MFRSASAASLPSYAGGRETALVSKSLAQLRLPAPRYELPDWPLGGESHAGSHPAVPATNVAVHFALLSTSSLPHSLTSTQPAAHAAAASVREAVHRVRDALLLARTYTPALANEPTVLQLLLDAAEQAAAVDSSRRQGERRAKQSSRGANANPSLSDEAPDVRSAQVALWHFVLGQADFLRAYADDMRRPSGAASPSATFFPSALVARRLFDDLKVLSDSLMLPLEVVQHRQQWLLLHEDTCVTLDDVLLHRRVVAVPEAPEERSREVQRLWSGLTGALAAAVRQRRRLFGPRVDLAGTVSLDGSQTAGSFSHDDSGAVDEWRHIAFGPFAPHVIAVTTEQGYAIRRPLCAMVHFALRGRRASSASSGDGPTCPFFDAARDERAFRCPYLSPQSYTAAAAALASAGPIVTFADDVWSLGVVALEYMLADFSISVLSVGTVQDGVGAVPLTRSVYDDLVAWRHARAPSVANSFGRGPQSAAAVTADCRFLYAVLRHLHALEGSALPSQQPPTPLPADGIGDARYVAHHLYAHLVARFPASLLRSVVGVGLTWARGEREAAFFAELGMAEWYERDGCGSCEDVATASCSRALEALRAPLVPLLAGTVPTEAHSAAVHAALQLLDELERRCGSADGALGVETDGNRHEETGGNGSGGSRCSLTSSTPQKGNGRDIIAFLHLLADWRTAVERAAVAEASASGSDDVKSGAVFAELVALVQSMAAHPTRNTGEAATAPPGTASSAPKPARVPMTNEQLLSRARKRSDGGGVGRPAGGNSAVMSSAKAAEVAPPLVVHRLLRALVHRQLLCSIQHQVRGAGGSVAPAVHLSEATMEVAALSTHLQDHLTELSRAAVSSRAAHSSALQMMFGGPMQGARRQQASQMLAAMKRAGRAVRKPSLFHRSPSATRSATAPVPPPPVVLGEPIEVLRYLDMNGVAQTELAMHLRELFVLLDVLASTYWRGGAPGSHCGAMGSPTQQATLVRDFFLGVGEEWRGVVPPSSASRPGRSLAVAVACVPDTLRGVTWGYLLHAPPRCARECSVLAHIDTGNPTSCDRQIAVDIPRCHQYCPQLASREGHEKLRRVLKAWLQLHPHLAYWQGLDSVCAVLLSVSYTDEPLVIAQLSALAHFFIPHYMCSQLPSSSAPSSPRAPPAPMAAAALTSPLFPHATQPTFPLQGRMEDRLHHFVCLLGYVDPELAHHLFDVVECRPELFSISWFLTLFAHNLPLKKAQLLWDALFLYAGFASDGEPVPPGSFPPPTVVACIACAVVMQLRDRLLCGDLTACLATLAAIHSINVKRVQKDTAVLLASVPPSVLAPPYGSEGDSSSGGYSAGPFTLHTSPVSLLDARDLRDACAASPVDCGGSSWSRGGLCVVDLRDAVECMGRVRGATRRIRGGLDGCSLLVRRAGSGDDEVVDGEEVRQLVHMIQSSPALYSLPPHVLAHGSSVHKQSQPSVERPLVARLTPLPIGLDPGGAPPTAPHPWNSIRSDRSQPGESGGPSGTDSSDGELLSATRSTTVGSLAALPGDSVVIDFAFTDDVLFHESQSRGSLSLSTEDQRYPPERHRSVRLLRRSRRLQRTQHGYSRWAFRALSSAPHVVLVTGVKGLPSTLTDVHHPIATLCRAFREAGLPHVSVLAGGAPALEACAPDLIVELSG